MQIFCGLRSESESKEHCDPVAAKGILFLPLVAGLRAALLMIFFFALKNMICNYFRILLKNILM
jgi:hypothetical protein